MLLSNTDTIVENLYYLLWIKEAGLRDSSFKIRIPDTILIKGRQLTGWYFSTPQNQIMKKKTANVSFDSVWESFNQEVGKSGIAAQLIWGTGKKERTTRILEKFQNKNQINASGNQEKVIIKYLGLKELRELLFEEIPNKNDYDESMILQRFIDPYGDNNTLIESVWSPSTCVFTRCVNKKNLNSLQYDAYERAVTFDGPAVFSSVSCLKGKAISGEIRQQCEHIVKKVAHVTYEKTMINRMTLYFKPDYNNTLYFLFCTSIRLKDEFAKSNTNNCQFNNTPLQIDSNFLPPPNMKNTYSVYMTRPARLTNDVQCLDCNKKFQVEDMVEMPLQLLLRTDIEKKVNKISENQNDQKTENDLRKNKKEKKVEVILTTNQIMQHLCNASSNTPFNLESTKQFMADKNPPPEHYLFKKLYPKMTKETFNQLLSNGYFERAKITVCNNCYYHYTSNQVITGAPLKGVEDIQTYLSHRAPQIHKFHDQYFQKSLPMNIELASSNLHLVKTDDPDKYQKRLLKMKEEEAILNHKLLDTKLDNSQYTYQSFSSMSNVIQQNKSQLKYNASASQLQSLNKEEQVEITENKLNYSQEIKIYEEEENNDNAASSDSSPLKSSYLKLENKNSNSNQKSSAESSSLENQQQQITPIYKNRIQTLFKEKNHNNHKKSKILSEENDKKVSIRTFQYEQKQKMKEDWMVPYLATSLNRTNLLRSIIGSSRTSFHNKQQQSKDSVDPLKQSTESFEQKKEQILKIYIKEEVNSKSSCDNSFKNIDIYKNNTQDTTTEILSDYPTQNLFLPSDQIPSSFSNNLSSQGGASFLSNPVSYRSFQHAPSNTQTIDNQRSNNFKEKQESLLKTNLINRDIKIRSNKPSQEYNSQGRPNTTQHSEISQLKNHLQIIKEDQLLIPPLSMYLPSKSRVNPLIYKSNMFNKDYFESKESETPTQSKSVKQQSFRINTPYRPETQQSSQRQSLNKFGDHTKTESTQFISQSHLTSPKVKEFYTSSKHLNLTNKMSQVSPNSKNKCQENNLTNSLPATSRNLNRNSINSFSQKDNTTPKVIADELSSSRSLIQKVKQK